MAAMVIEAVTVPTVESDRAAADVLAGRIAVAASLAAHGECALLDLIGEFDSTNAIRRWRDVKSLAHWLSWSCSMSPGAARERVRVARALRQMPTVRSAFAAGRLSYSKVREVSRVVGVVDEARLCELALTATASQLARTVAGFRAAHGSRLPQQARRRASVHTREDGMVEIRALLPAEEGAVVVAALDAAEEQPGCVSSRGATRISTCKLTTGSAGRQEARRIWPTSSCCADGTTRWSTREG